MLYRKDSGVCTAGVEHELYPHWTLLHVHRDQFILYVDQNVKGLSHKIINNQILLDFFSMYCIQHCFICRPSDCTVPEDAGIEPRTVVTLALAVRHSNQRRASTLTSRSNARHRSNTQPTIERSERSYFFEKSKAKIVPSTVIFINR
jgi:hypothetical protein